MRDKQNCISISVSIFLGLFIDALVFRVNGQLKKINVMTERELRKLEATIRIKMEEIKKQRVSLKESGIGGLMNSLKKVDEALYEKILPEYKKMVADYNIFK
jgi:hypothetical protein